MPPHPSSFAHGSPGDTSSIHSTNMNGRRQRPRASLRVRNMANGVVYHLVFEGDIRRLSGKQLRHHLAQICHIPPAEQHLVIHGGAFSDKAHGAQVGLLQDDTVDLYRGESASAAFRRGPSAATASSLRPSTDAGTMSPAPPEDHIDGASAGMASSHRPARMTAAARSSMGSTVTSNSRRVAPSPDRLVERAGQRAPQQQQRQQQLPPEQYTQRDAYRGRVYDGSQLLHSTSATTMSSLHASRRCDGEASPRPHMPYSTSYYADAPSAQLPPRDPGQRSTGMELPSDDAAAAMRGPHRPSYEVPSPYDRPPPRRDVYEGHRSNAPSGRISSSSHYDPAARQRGGPVSGFGGLNQSRRDFSLNDGSGGARHARQPSPPPPPPLPQPSHLYTGGTQMHHSLMDGAAPGERAIAVRADDLEALLDEQDYIWRMEEYRFRTERLNRLSALQNRQRELSFEAARYDQQVAFVSSQLNRERQKLTELQEAMSHHSASLGEGSQRGQTAASWMLRRGVPLRAAAEDENDGASEVIDVSL